MEIPVIPAPTAVRPPNNLLTLLFALIFLLIGGVGGFYLGKSSVLDQPKTKPEEVARTKLSASEAIAIARENP